MALTYEQARARNRSELARLSALPKQITRTVTKNLRRSGQTQVLDVKRRFLGRPGLIPRSGQFRGSFRYRLDGENTEKAAMSVYTTGTTARTLTGQPMSRLQQFGGVIRPVTARALTIPIGINRLPNGLPRWRSAAELRAQGRTLLRKTSKGQFIILVHFNNEFRPAWLLRQRVVIPPRLRFFQSFAERDSSRKATLIADVRATIQAN